MDEFLATRRHEPEPNGLGIPLALEPGCEVLALDDEGRDALPGAEVELSLVGVNGERIHCTGAPLVLPAVSRSKRFVIRAPGYRSRELVVEPGDERRELVLVRGVTARFRVRTGAEQRRILVRDGADVVEAHEMEADSQGFALALPAGDFTASLEGRSSSFHDWRLLDTETLRVSGGIATPEIVTLVEERADASLVCELSPIGLGPSSSVEVLLENEHGIEWDRVRVDAKQSAEPESRVVSFRPAPAGPYRVLLLPHLVERSVVLVPGQERRISLDWGGERTLELHVIDRSDSSHVEEADVSILLPEGMGPWGIERDAGSGAFRFSTCLSAVQLRVSANGYKSEVESLELALDVTSTVIELEPVESSWIRLRVLERGDAILMTARDLIDHLSVRTPGGDDVRMVNIKAKSHLPGRFRECRVEFQHTGTVLVEFENEARGGTKTATVTLVSGETGVVDLELNEPGSWR